MLGSLNGPLYKLAIALQAVVDNNGGAAAEAPAEEAAPAAEEAAPAAEAPAAEAPAAPAQPAN